LPYVDFYFAQHVSGIASVGITDFGGCFTHTHHPTLKVGWNATRRGIGHEDVRKFTHKIILVGQ